MEGRGLSKWLVATAWPYVNYVPHLGNLIGSVLSADIFARYLRLKGEEVLFVSGSDQHGTPIEVEAQRLNVSPKELADRNHGKISLLFKKWNISFDNYTGTESPVHKEFVTDFYRKVERNGYIFRQELDLPYCPTDQRFLPDRFIEGVCPECGAAGARGDQCETCGHLLDPARLVEPYCVICHSKPELRKTTHWFLDLSAFEEELRTYIKENTELPENAKRFSLNWIEEGLKPRSITRDNKWGVPSPFKGSEGKTIYVWVEAVLGYLSATVEYFQKTVQPNEWREFWTGDNSKSIFFVGKDNIPFHTIILPALLLASGDGYNLPWRVESTEFLLFEGQKFSKSHRVGVWIDEAIEQYPVDYWRYALVQLRPETKDTSFTWELFREFVNAHLNDTLGNFVHRTLTFLTRYFDGVVPEPSPLQERDREVLDRIIRTQTEVASNIETFRYRDALTAAMQLARAANKYLNDTEPWHLIKTDRTAAATALYVSVQVVKALTTLIEPFIPTTAEELWKQLQLPGNLRSLGWSHTTERIPVGHKIGEPKQLFRKAEEPVHQPEGGGSPKLSMKPTVTIEEFNKLDIRVGKIVKAERIQGYDRLLRVQVDVAGSTKKAIAGLGHKFQPENLIGKNIIVVLNLKPAKIGGEMSEAMLLAAEDSENIVLLTTASEITSGSRVR